MKKVNVVDIPDATSTREPLMASATSVIIAAHNEESVIGRCLDALVHEATGETLEIIVAANGCVDDTVGIAADYPGVRVVEVDRASKAGALNAADAIAHGFPRIYLDADIVLPHGATVALAAAVSQGAGRPLAAVPRRVLRVNGRPLAVQAYFAINRRHPAFRRSLFGRGAIALSAEGRSRFAEFPDMVADDLFLDSLFADEEKIQVDAVEVTVETPLRTRDLLRRLVRVRRGNAAMRKAADVGAITARVRRADRMAWLWDVVRPEPRLAPAAVVYVGLTVLASILARRTPAMGREWGRDESTRTATGTVRT